MSIRLLRSIRPTPTAFLHPSSSSSHHHRTITTVPLTSDIYTPSSSSSSSSLAPLIVLHGLYGSKQNWRSQAKGMAQRLGRQVITLDLRNHGTSPHSPEVTYAAMAEDVAAFMDGKGLESGVTVVGHSMGGKVAMALALRPHKAIDKLVVVDIAPGTGKISPEFKVYLDAMKEIDGLNVASRKDADVILAKYEPDLGVRQFLLTNLEKPSGSSSYKFRLPLQYLDDAIPEIGKFPYDVGQRTFEGPTLFLKGSKSKYINKRNIPILKEYFPKARLEVLETGHWVHAEKPKEFLDLVDEFVKQ